MNKVLKKTCGSATRQKIESVGNSITNMLPIAQTAMQHFKLSMEATKTRDETSGHNILRDIQSFLQKVFLDTDKNGDFSLIKPSTHLYTVGHEKEIDHFFEPQFYPSTIMTNAEKFVEPYISTTLESISKNEIPENPDQDSTQPRKGEEEDDNNTSEMSDEMLFDVVDEVYEPEEAPSDDS